MSAAETISLNSSKDFHSLKIKPEITPKKKVPGTKLVSCFVKHVTGVRHISTPQRLTQGVLHVVTVMSNLCRLQMAKSIHLAIIDIVE